MKLSFNSFDEIHLEPPDPESFDYCYEFELRLWRDDFKISGLGPFSLQIVRGLLPVSGTVDKPRIFPFGFIGTLSDWETSLSCWESCALLKLEAMMWFPRTEMFFYAKDWHVYIFLNENRVEKLPAVFTPCKVRPDVSLMTSNEIMANNGQSLMSTLTQVVRSYEKLMTKNPFLEGRSYELIHSSTAWKGLNPSPVRYVLPPWNLEKFFALIDYMIDRFLKKGSWIMFDHPLLSRDIQSAALDMYLQKIGASHSLFNWPYYESTSDDSRALGLAYRYGALEMFEAYLYCPQAGFTCVFHHDDAIVLTAMDPALLQTVYDEVTTRFDCRDIKLG